LESKAKNIMAVQVIIKLHHTKNVHKIKKFLVDEYGVSVSDKTIRNYKNEIKRKSQKKIKTEKKVIRQEKTVKTENAEITYPYQLKDPKGVSHTVPHDHYGISIPWGRDSICWNTKDPIWRWSSSGIEYGKKGNKVPTIWRMPKSKEQEWASEQGDF